MSTMEEWVRDCSADIKQTFPHHLIIVWYPRGEWAVSVDNLRIDHIMCLMAWLDTKMREQGITTSQRYQIYRGFGYSRMRSWLYAWCRP
jgi:hypothetical protein